MFFCFSLLICCLAPDFWQKNSTFGQASAKQRFPDKRGLKSRLFLRSRSIVLWDPKDHGTMSKSGYRKGVQKWSHSGWEMRECQIAELLQFAIHSYLPRHPNASWEGIFWTPKTYPKHQTSGCLTGLPSWFQTPTHLPTYTQLSVASSSLRKKNE